MAKITLARRTDMERTYPELRLKRFRARMGLSLFLFSAAIFATIPFYGPAADDKKFHYFSIGIWVLPLAFFLIFVRARAALAQLQARVEDLQTARKSNMPVIVYLANYTVRSGRGFSYRVTLPGRAPEVAVSESNEFVGRLGYSEQGGEPVEKKSGKEIFGHSLIIKPVYRKYDFDATAYTRVGYTKPFLLVGADGIRLWLNDRA